MEMKFYNPIFCDEKLNRKKAKIIRKLKNSKLQLPIYIIALGSGSDQLEIYNSAYLLQDYAKKNPPIIVGIASNRDSALKIVEEITAKVYAECGNANIKEYINKTGGVAIVNNN